MSEQPGKMMWCDLTVVDAEAIRDFYSEVVGWTAQPLDMGGYSDYVMMQPGTEEGVAGICHKRGPNAEIPSQWLVYFTVADLDVAIQNCTARGGHVVVGPREMGESRYAIISDPAGAVCALFQSG